MVGGDRFGPTYAEEFGAWKAAIRDAKGRVQWSTVRKSLTGYLYDDPVYHRVLQDRLASRGVARGTTDAQEQRWETASTAAYEATLDRHLAVLKRYARVVKRRAR